MFFLIKKGWNLFLSKTGLWSCLNNSLSTCSRVAALWVRNLWQKLQCLLPLGPLLRMRLRWRFKWRLAPILDQTSLLEAPRASSHWGPCSACGIVCDDDSRAPILHLASLPEAPGAPCYWDLFSTWAYGCKWWLFGSNPSPGISAKIARGFMPLGHLLNMSLWWRRIVKTVWLQSFTWHLC